MSFREKSAWIALLAYGGVFGAYFFFVWQAWAVDENFGSGVTIPLLIGAVVTFVIIMTVLTIVAALLNPKAANAPADERETLIELKAERAASYALSTGVVLLIGALLMGWNGFLVANLLLASMVISELMKAGWQIVSFRGGVQ